LRAPTPKLGEAVENCCLSLPEPFWVAIPDSKMSCDTHMDRQTDTRFIFIYKMTKRKNISEKRNWLLVFLFYDFKNNINFFFHFHFISLSFLVSLSVPCFPPPLK
jgi:hypothetical protein